MSDRSVFYEKRLPGTFKKVSPSVKKDLETLHFRKNKKAIYGNILWWYCH